MTAEAWSSPDGSKAVKRTADRPVEPARGAVVGASEVVTKESEHVGQGVSNGWEIVECWGGGERETKGRRDGAGHHRRERRRKGAMGAGRLGGVVRARDVFVSRRRPMVCGSAGAGGYIASVRLLGGRAC